jgi:hypothetical protein
LAEPQWFDISTLRYEEATVLKTSFFLPDRLWESAKARAAKERRSLGEILVDALRAYLKTPPKSPGRAGKASAS